MKLFSLKKPANQNERLTDPQTPGPWYLHCRTTVILFMGWHSRSPSVIKHGTAVTLQHGRQTGWDNEPLSLGASQGAGAGRGRCGQGAGSGVGLLPLASGLSPPPPLTRSRLSSWIPQEKPLKELENGLLGFAPNTWHLVETDWGGRRFPAPTLYCSVLLEIGKPASRYYLCN